MSNRLTSFSFNSNIGVSTKSLLRSTMNKPRFNNSSLIGSLILLIIANAELSTALHGRNVGRLHAHHGVHDKSNLWARVSPNDDVSRYRVKEMAEPAPNDTDTKIPSYKITLELEGLQELPYSDFICRPVIPSQSQSTSRATSLTGTTTTGSGISDTSSFASSVTLMSLTTSETQTPTTWVSTDTSGSMGPTKDPTQYPPIRSNTFTASTSLPSVSPSTSPTSIIKSSLEVSDVFKPMTASALPSQITARENHPIQPVGVNTDGGRPGTNKFYTSLLSDDQWAPIFTFPYSLQWSRGAGPAKDWGLAVSHTERYQLAHAPAYREDGGEWHYFYNPAGIHSLALSAVELDSNTKLTTDASSGSSVNVSLTPGGGAVPLISFPVVQGMAFVTGNYQSATPVITSTVGMNNVTYDGELTKGLVHKYTVRLADSTSWLVYVTPLSADYAVSSFTLLTPNMIQGAANFRGTVQVAKYPVVNPKRYDMAIYDESAGTYPTGASVSGSISGATGSYTFSWTKGGIQSQSLLMFALPHHVKSFDSSTRANVTALALMTTTKGLSFAVRADKWTMVEDYVPVDMDFAPWRPDTGSNTAVSADAAALINDVGISELSQNILLQVSGQESMYFAGKLLAKYAGIIYTLHDITKNASLALSGLQGLKDAFALFVDNRQRWPLVYDTVWGGVVTSAGYDNLGADFGATKYTDHQFHYGYFVHAAAIIAYLDPSWLLTGTNKEWVDMLVRDYANPAGDDKFPFSRGFDWYNGHSWSGGLGQHADGQDQESSSEDTLASYALKMWGRVTGDLAMEGRGTLMLAIQARSLADYYLYTSDNTVQPAEYIGNKAAGILFENKIDHQTYFGLEIEKVQGINMLPILAHTGYIRSSKFVQEEWDTYFASGISKVTDGWRGIIEANRAIIDPKTSYAFFSGATGQWDPRFLDDGASRTWFLAYSAAMGGAPANA